MATRILKYFILLALLLLIAAVVSFWIGGPSFREQDVALGIDGPIQASAGDEVLYILRYSNQTKTPLHNVKIAFHYPKNSAVIKDGKIDLSGNETFIVDELKPGEGGQKEFRIFLLGGRGDIKTAKALISFKAGNLRSSFEKEESLSTTIISTPIALTMVAPPTANPGQPIDYILDYRNESDGEAADLVFEFSYPDGFKPQEFVPAPDSGNSIWTRANLRAGSGSRISIKGVIDGREGDERVATVQLKRKIAGEYVEYQKVSVKTVISNPVLNLEVLAGNTSDYASHLNDRISYAVKYANNSDAALKGMNLTVRFEGDMFDFANLDTRGGFFESGAKTITWDPTVIREFANLRPGARGQLVFDIGIKPFFSSIGPGGSKDRFVKVSASFGTSEAPEGMSQDQVSVSHSLVTKITTQPFLGQTAYHNDPEFGSSGPWPPEAGRETFIAVHWQVTNPGNAIDGASAVARLPDNVEWVGTSKASPSDKPVPVFNPNKSEIFWNLGLVPYGTGVFTEKYEAVFLIKLKPANDQKGEIANLLEGVGFAGTDSFTKQEVAANAADLTTDGLADRPGEGTIR